RLPCRRDAFGDVLAHVQLRGERPPFLHAQQRALLRLARPGGEAAPAKQPDELRERPRREVGAIFAGLERAPRPREELELLRRLRHAPGERGRLPVEAGVARLHGLVALAVQAPVEVEAVDLVPIALAQRIGKAAVARPAG